MKVYKWCILILFFILVSFYLRSESFVRAEQKAQDQIKADSVCIGEDCRSRWPVLKCAVYSDRPAGETGDEFCNSMNKTCMGVFMGSGQSFFNECSVPANSVHKCRCCWAE